jgi:hypothetical protein
LFFSKYKNEKYNKNNIVNSLFHIVDVPMTIVGLYNKFKINNNNNNNNNTENPPSLFIEPDGIDQSSLFIKSSSVASSSSSSSSSVTSIRQDIAAVCTCLSNSAAFIEYPYKLLIGRDGDGRVIEEPVNTLFVINNPTLIDMIDNIIVDFIEYLSPNLFPFQWVYIYYYYY